MGQVKLHQYGETFLEVIKAFCEKHGLKENLRRKESPSPGGRGARGEGEVSPRTRIIAEAFNEGATIQALMEQYGFVANTILDHLSKYLLAGNGLRKSDDLLSLTSATTEQRQTVFAAFDEFSPTYLKPVFDTLNGELNYDELKILRMIYLISRQETQ